MVKDVKYIYSVKKRLVWVVLDRGERENNIKIGLEEGEVIEMSTTVLSIYAMLAPSLLIYLPVFKETPAASSSPSRSAIEV